MKRLVMIAMAAAALSACESPMGPVEPNGPPPPPSYQALPPATAFDPAEFAWSSGPGPGSLSGQFAFHHGADRYSCQGEDVLLIPETPWSRRRMIILYGAAAAASAPASVVRARQPSAPSGDYARYVRSTTCGPDNRFAFQGLPMGAWYVVTIGKPLGGQGEAIAVTRRVEIQNGPRMVTLY